MTLENLSNDFVAVLKEIFPVKAVCPNLILVGHSMVS